MFRSVWICESLEELREDSRGSEVLAVARSWKDTPLIPLACHPPDPDDQYKLTEDTRQLGLVVCRGTSVVLICPQDGMEAIPNPFVQQQDS